MPTKLFVVYLSIPYSAMEPVAEFDTFPEALCEAVRLRYRHPEPAIIRVENWNRCDEDFTGLTEEETDQVLEALDRASSGIPSRSKEAL